MSTLTLLVLPEKFAVCRLPADVPLPNWARGKFVSITRTHDELSIVCAQENLPDTIQCERDWRALCVAGQLDFGLTGILASLAAPLAEAGISIFAISTFDTDYILVKQISLDHAIQILMRVGHHIELP